MDPCRPRDGAVEVVGLTNSASASRRPRVLMYERTQPVAAGNRSLGFRAERNQLWPGVRRAEFERSVRALALAMLDEDAQDPVGALDRLRQRSASRRPARRGSCVGRTTMS